MFDKITNKVTMIILKTIISRYFDNLKVAGYKLSVSEEKDSYKIEANLPKQSINNLVNKFKK
ncbi:MAG: hypothetical protein IJ890_05635 [Clostridia bacterium]|nr:hypothetical protein [Clostridia bacterium]